MNVRPALLAVSLSLLAMLGNVAPASAADPVCDDVVALQASVDDAHTALVVAKVAFHAVNRPLGRLVAAKRHEAKAQPHAQHRGRAEAPNLLSDKRTALDAVKADRRAARVAVAAARTALRDLEKTQDSCGSSAEDD
ncbi:hypothetical protein BH10ACT10_BH10ACT10_05450 [soil metagenome]